MSGWIAHAIEQRRANRIIRPQSEYVGPSDRRWVQLADRVELTEKTWMTNARGERNGTTR